MRYDDSLNVLLILINAIVLGGFVLVIVVAENYNINWSEIQHSCPGWRIIEGSHEFSNNFHGSRIISGMLKENFSKNSVYYYQSSWMFMCNLGRI